jgi:bla regulator protein BlaR1
MGYLPVDFALAPADSARAVAQVYTVSLLATGPLVVAGIAALALRRCPAGTRALVWRSAVLALLILYVGRHLPARWEAWIVPGALAEPLVALGRMQVTVAGRLGAVSGTLESWNHAPDPGAVLFVHVLRAIYWIGVLLVLMPLLRAWLDARSTAGRAQPLRDETWLLLLDEVRMTLGVRRSVRCLVSADTLVSVTWGVIRPVVLLPAGATLWDESRRRAVLLHELAHVRAADALFRIAARVGCALFWFHPGAWWVARGLRAECELACDDRVLAAGVRASDYAELLAASADTLRPAQRARSMALALARRGGLRERLAAIIAPRRDLRAPTRISVAVAVAITVAVSGPLSTLDPAPTRDVLRELMRDSRWESRAYAVLGLAPRADSVGVARAAAVADPSPHVRAWAIYALSQHPAALRTVASPPEQR